MKIEIKNVTKTVYGRPLLNQVNMQMESGKGYGIVGENGSGKTMLLRSIAGLLEIDEGEFFVDGKKIKRFSEEISVGITIESASIYQDMTLLDNLKYYKRLSGKANKEELLELCDRVGLKSVAKKKVNTYSLGMRQRAVIAQALLDKPDILLLDEPTNGLDANGKDKILELLKEEKKRGTILFIISHEMSFFKDIIDEQYHMKEGVLSHE